MFVKVLKIHYPKKRPVMFFFLRFISFNFVDFWVTMDNKGKDATNRNSAQNRFSFVVIYTYVNTFKIQ